MTDDRATRGGRLAWLKAAGSFCAVLVLLFLAFKDTDPEGLLAVLRATNPWTVAFTVCVVLFGLVFKSLRWEVMLRRLSPGVRFSDVLSAVAIGLLGNHVLPAKAGEFISAYFIARKENIGSASSFATIIVERILDLLVVLVVCGVVIGVLALDLQHASRLIFVGTAIVLPATIGVLVLVRYHDLWLRLVDRIFSGRVAVWLHGHLMALREGFTTLNDWRRMFLCIFWTLLLWATVVLALWPLLAGMDFGLDLPFHTVFVVLLFFTFSQAIPLTPAGVGLYQYACLLAMQTSVSGEAGSAQLDLNTVAAFSILSHVVMVVPEIIVGLVVLYKEGLTWFDLRSSGKGDPLADNSQLQGKG